MGEIWEMEFVRVAELPVKVVAREVQLYNYYLSLNPYIDERMWLETGLPFCLPAHTHTHTHTNS